MGEDRGTGDTYRVSTGDVSGQMVVGSHNRAMQIKGAPAPPTEEELADLRRAFEELRSAVAAEAPADTRDDALGRAKELERAVVAGTPDLSTMEYVKGWFARNLPKLAGAVAAIFVHPVVGKLVEAAGEAAMGEYRRRFPEAASAS